MADTRPFFVFLGSVAYSLLPFSPNDKFRVMSSLYLWVYDLMAVSVSPLSKSRVMTMVVAHG